MANIIYRLIWHSTTLGVDGRKANKSERVGVYRPLVSPYSFSGLSNWTEWIDCFEAAALVNGWDDEKKRLWFPGRLTEKEQTVCKRLSAETRESYAAAKEALQKWFEPVSENCISLNFRPGDVREMSRRVASQVNYVF